MRFEHWIYTVRPGGKPPLRLDAQRSSDNRGGDNSARRGGGVSESDSGTARGHGRSDRGVAIRMTARLCRVGAFHFSRGQRA